MEKPEVYHSYMDPNQSSCDHMEQPVVVECDGIQILTYPQQTVYAGAEA